MASRNCENCPVGRAQGPCETVPKSPHTCVKRVNGIINPPINEQQFFKLQVEGFGVVPLPNVISPSLKDQFADGSWRQNEDIINIQPAINITDGSFVGVNVLLKNGDEVFVET